MKQSELDRHLKQICKVQAKRRGWKSVGGMAYWTSGSLFFVLVVAASAREDSFYCSLRFKWLELDRVLWRVLGMSSNELEPFSLHANGAFVLTGQEIFNASKHHSVWTDDVLQSKVTEVSKRASQKSQGVASKINSLESYLTFIQQEHEVFMKSFPRAVVNVHKEELLVALICNDRRRAEQIARARIAVHDSGGFSSNGKSFYESALAFCHQ